MSLLRVQLATAVDVLPSGYDCGHVHKHCYLPPRPSVMPGGLRNHHNVQCICCVQLGTAVDALLSGDDRGHVPEHLDAVDSTMAALEAARCVPHTFAPAA